MEKKRFDFRTIMLLAVLFLSNIAIMGTSFYTVIMTQLYANFDEGVINLTMSIPAIAGMIACLLCGKISDHVDKKWLFVIGLVLFAITGSNIGGAAYNSNLLMIGASFFNGGICYGMISVSAIGLINDCFQNESQRSMVMGWYNGAMALVGAALSMSYGFIATIDWKLASQVNWSALVVAILAVIFVPACPPVKRDVSQVNAKSAAKKGWWKALVPLVLAFFFVSFAVMAVETYIDLYVTANNLGDSAFTGLLGTVQTITSFFACTFFGFTSKKLGKKLSPLAYLLLGAGVLLLMFFPTRTMAIVGFAILGMAWGSVYTYWFFRTTVVVPEEMVGTATGIVTTANSLSYMPIAYCVTGFMALQKTNNFKDTFWIYAAIIFVACVTAIVLNSRKKTAQEAAE